MKTRILTAVIALPLLLVALYFGEMNHWIITILISLATVLMAGEILTAKHLNNNMFITVPCLLFAFVTPLLSHTQFVYIPVNLFILSLFSILIFKHNEISYGDLAFAFTGTCVITFGVSCLTYMCATYNSFTSIFIIMILGIPWMADAGAYFVGTFFGKHKLCPNISPKKTVEGFLGGVVVCIAASLLIGVVFQTLIYKNATINYISLLIIGILDSFVSVLGDLSFSLIKRHCKIKDYGSIFPGHGGMLDRCDSVIFTAPLVLTVHQLLPIIA